MATKKKAKHIEDALKINMTFDEAMKKALSTPIPKKKAKKKS
jgi:hypothetical protein